MQRKHLTGLPVAEALPAVDDLPNGYPHVVGGRLYVLLDGTWTLMGEPEPLTLPTDDLWLHYRAEDLSGLAEDDPVPSVPAAGDAQAGEALTAVDDPAPAYSADGFNGHPAVDLVSSRLMVEPVTLPAGDLLGVVMAMHFIGAPASTDACWSLHPEESSQVSLQMEVNVGAGGETRWILSRGANASALAQGLFTGADAPFVKSTITGPADALAIRHAGTEVTSDTVAASGAPTGLMLGAFYNVAWGIDHPPMRIAELAVYDLNSDHDVDKVIAAEAFLIDKYGLGA